MTASEQPVIPELKPCPFCGSEAVIEDSGPIDKYRSGYQIRCPALKCPVDNPVAFGDTENEAIAAWNTRELATVAELRAENLRLKTAYEQQHEIVLRKGEELLDLEAMVERLKDGQDFKLLKRIVEKLHIALPIVDRFISLQAIRSGNNNLYDGPSLEQELKEADALIAARAQPKGEPK